MNKKEIFQLLYIVLILGLLIFMGWMMVWLSGEGGNCVAHPLKYYEDKTNLTCRCERFSGLNPSNLNFSDYLTNYAQKSDKSD